MKKIKVHLILGCDCSMEEASSLSLTFATLVKEAALRGPEEISQALYLSLARTLKSANASLVETRLHEDR